MRFGGKRGLGLHYLKRLPVVRVALPSPEGVDYQKAHLLVLRKNKKPSDKAFHHNQSTGLKRSGSPAELLNISLPGEYGLRDGRGYKPSLLSERVPRSSSVLGSRSHAGSLLCLHGESP